MGLKRRRARLMTAVGVALLCGIGAVWIAVSLNNVDSLLEVEIFSAPTPVCDEYKERTFTQAVADVEATEDPALESAVSKVRAGYLRKTAELDPAPEGVRLQLIALADQVEAAARSKDYGEAAATAAALDAELTVFCTD